MRIHILQYTLEQNGKLLCNVLILHGKPVNSCICNPSLVPVSVEALQRERRQMQAKHLWYKVNIRWSDHWLEAEIMPYVFRLVGIAPLMDPALAATVAALGLYLREGNTVEDLVNYTSFPTHCNLRQRSIVLDLLPPARRNG